MALTDRELRRLRRADLLEMLMEQKKLAAAAQKKMEEERTRREESEGRLKDIEEAYKLLLGKLDEREREIGDLRAALEEVSDKATPEVFAKLTARINKATARLEEAIDKLGKN